MEISRCAAAPLTCYEKLTSHSSGSDRENSAETTYRGSPKKRVLTPTPQTPDDATWLTTRKRSCVTKFERGASDELIRMSLQPARANDGALQNAAQTLASMHRAGVTAHAMKQPQQSVVDRVRMPFDPLRLHFNRDLRRASAETAPASMRVAATLRLLQRVANCKLGLKEYHAVITATVKLLGECRLQTVEAADIDQALIFSASQAAPSDVQYIRSVRAHGLKTLGAMPPLCDDAAAAAWLRLAAKMLDGEGGLEFSAGVLHECEQRINEDALRPATRAGLLTLAAQAANAHEVNPLENNLQWRRCVLAELTAHDTPMHQKNNLFTKLAEGRFGLRNTRLFDAAHQLSGSELARIMDCIESPLFATAARTDLLLQCIDILPRAVLPADKTVSVPSLRKRLIWQIADLISPQHLQPPALSLIVKKISDVSVLRSLHLRPIDYRKLIRIAEQSAQERPNSDMPCVALVLRLMPNLLESIPPNARLARNVERALILVRKGAPASVYESRLAIMLMSLHDKGDITLSDIDKIRCMEFLSRSLHM